MAEEDLVVGVDGVEEGVVVGAVVEAEVAVDGAWGRTSPSLRTSSMQS